MKFLFSLFLLTVPVVSNQAVIYNAPTDYVYIVDFTQNPIEIFSVHEKTLLPITCLNNQVKALKDVNFSSASSCLVRSLNEAFDFSIEHTVDMNHAFSKEEIKQVAKEKKMSQIFSLIKNTNTSYSFFQLYEMFNEARKNDFSYQFRHPILLKVEDSFLPLSR